MEPAGVHRSSLVDLHQGTDDNRTATALGDVARAAAVFPSNPPGRRWGTANVHCCAVMIQSRNVSFPTCGQKDHLRTPGGGRPEPLTLKEKSSLATQQSVGHRRVATRKATGDPATHGGAGDPECAAEQCVGTCDRGLKGVAHRRSTFTQRVTAVAAE